MRWQCLHYTMKLILGCSLSSNPTFCQSSGLSSWRFKRSPWKLRWNSLKKCKIIYLDVWRPEGEAAFYWTFNIEYYFSSSRFLKEIIVSVNSCNSNRDSFNWFDLHFVWKIDVQSIWSKLTWIVEHDPHSVCFAASKGQCLLSTSTQGVDSIPKKDGLFSSSLRSKCAKNAG